MMKKLVTATLGTSTLNVKQQIFLLMPTAIAIIKQQRERKMNERSNLKTKCFVVKSFCLGEHFKAFTVMARDSDEALRIADPDNSCRRSLTATACGPYKTTSWSGFTSSRTEERKLFKYKVSWVRGREKGALGVFSSGSIIVTASSPEQARLEAYKTHEHLFQITVVKL